MSTRKRTNIKDIIGERFGRLVVMERAPVSSTGHSMWKCTCDCGKDTVCAGSRLWNGYTRSCGCLRHDTGVKNGRATLRHGMCGTPEYRSWLSMIQRCTNANSKVYTQHGARGIKVCARWRHSFENFYADMGLRPSDEHSLDRYPNNDGNYEPGNCRWATMQEQSRNRRTNVIITAFGKTAPLIEFVAIYDRASMTRYSRVRRRLSKGWDVERALTEP